MKKMLFAGLCMAALATSCSDSLNVDGTHSVELNAAVTAEQSRAAFLADASFYWQTGDQIGVLTQKENQTITAFTSLDLKTGAGTGSATFSGTISGSLGGYAIYPYDAAQRLSDNTLTYTFPSSYKYTKVDQTFFPSTKDGNSFNPAMLAKISNGSVAFNHLGGVFCISVESMPCAAGTMTLATDQALCGAYTANVTDATPELKTTSTVATTNNKVSIEFEGAVVGKPGVFYVPCPTGTYDNATITFTAEGQKPKVIVAGQYKVDRRKLKKLELTETTIKAETVATAATASDAQKTLESNNNVAVTSVVETGATITIPEVATSTSTGTSGSGTSTETTTSSKTLTLQKVAAKAEITVADAGQSTSGSTDGKSSVQELTISIPNTTTEDAPTVNVTMPKSTVTLAGNAGEANFKTVTASTAENTLIVSSGVTIQKLVIAKGNVRINKGAVVKEIAYGSDIHSATIYYEPGATMPTTLPESGITKIGVIETEAQFNAAMKNGGDYKLFKDVTVTEKANITSSAKAVVDLNHKTLYMNFYIKSQDGGDLTFKNGTVTQLTNVKDDDGGFLAGTNGKVTIDSITYNGRTGTWDCLFVPKQVQGATFVVRNSKITGGTYAITTNATINPVATATITLENSEFIADHSAAMLNIPATVVMKKCSFSADHQGALLRGGNYTISDCTFTLNAALPDSHEDNKWLQDWKDGCIAAFAALTLGNYVNKAYQYKTDVKFSGENKTIVEGTYKDQFPAIHVCANQQADSLGVFITGLSTITLTQIKSTPDNGPEYGTTNITVDGKKIEKANISLTTKARRRK